MDDAEYNPMPDNLTNVINFAQEQQKRQKCRICADRRWVLNLDGELVDFQNCYCARS
jgi:hypothetical protein